MSVVDADPKRTAVASRQEVTRADLPLSCPTPNKDLWNAHPRVYLPIEKTGYTKCPYCGTEFVLVDNRS